jgi:hypothetical protein
VSDVFLIAVVMFFLYPALLLTFLLDLTHDDRFLYITVFRCRVHRIPLENVSFSQGLKTPDVWAKYSSFLLTNRVNFVCKPVLIRLTSGSRIYFTPADRQLFYFEIRAAQEKLQRPLETSSFT